MAIEIAQNRFTTMTPSNAAAGVWDIVVVGAGPAGSIAATCAARQGLRVLLLDRQTPPRDKPCGGCLNAAAVEILSSLGLLSELKNIDPAPLTLFRFRNGPRRLTLPFSGMSIARDQFDAMLVRHALEAGAEFLAPAFVRQTELQSDRRTIMAHCGELNIVIHSKVVICASGLGSAWLQSAAALDDQIKASSSIGLSTTVETADPAFDRGSLEMIVADCGYAGIVRQTATRLHIGACVRRDALATLGAKELVTQILLSAGMRIPELEGAHWHGTPHLTHRRRAVAIERLFVIGDAAGYSEPFTGEGVAWALASGALVAGLAIEGVNGWRGELTRRWQEQYRLSIQRRQRWSLLLRHALRGRLSRKLLVAALQQFPRATEALLAELSASYLVQASVDGHMRPLEFPS